MDRILRDKVISGAYLTEWSDNNYQYFFNVTRTGQEKYGDYTLVMTKTPHGGRKYGRMAEVTKELISDPNFTNYAKITTENIKYPTESPR